MNSLRLWPRGVYAQIEVPPIFPPEVTIEVIDAAVLAILTALGLSEEAILSLINENEGELNAALAAIAQNIQDQVIGEADRVIADVGGDIHNAQGIILDQLDNTQATLGSTIDAAELSITTSIDTSTETIASDIAESEEQITTFINNELGSIAAVLEGSLGELTAQLQSNVTQILENVATVDEVLTTAKTFLVENAPALGVWLQTQIVGGLIPGLMGTLDGLELEKPAALDTFLDFIIGQECLPPYIRDLAQNVKDASAPLLALLLPILLGVMLVPAAAVALEPPLECLRQIVWSIQPVRLLPVGDLATAWLRGDIDDGQYKGELAKAGYSDFWAGVVQSLQFKPLDPPALLRARYRGAIDEDAFRLEMQKQGLAGEQADLLANTAGPLLEELEVRNAFLRGLIDEPTHDARLAQFGYAEADVTLRKLLYFFVPPPQDLIQMAVREAFDPAQVEALTLDADFPADFAAFALQQGISEDWAHKYWQAHWQLPSPLQVFEMLHRGIVDAEEVTNYLRVADFAPVWRDRLQAISFNPLTRVDTRRMHKLGVLDDDETLQAYRDIGYNEENAQRLLDFTIALNAEEEQAAIEPFRFGLKSAAVRLYADFIMTEGDFRSIMADLLYTDEQIDAFVAEAIFLREGDRAQQVRGSIKKLFVDGRWTREQAGEALTAEGFGVEETNDLLSRWDLDRLYKDLTPVETEARDLTRAETLAAYREALITQTETRDFLIGMGYDEGEADILIALADIQAAREAERAKRDLIRVKYLRGLLTRGEASAQLDVLELRSEHRDALLDRWEVERAEKGDKVPVSVIQNLFLAGSLDPFRAGELLLAHGWSEDVIRAAIAGWKSGRKLVS